MNDPSTSDSLPMSPRFAPERLLEHVAWVRRLAARLIDDHHAADDVAQETLAIALRGGPRDASRARPWLAAIARSVASRMRRTRRRREARELVAASAEALDATDEIVARASLQRAVVDAVLALAEPYRTIILRRFFDELPSREIARRRGEPVETVRTRMKRGLALLRERLAGELAIETERGLITILAGAPFMAAKVKLALAAALVIAGVWITTELSLNDATPAIDGDGDEVATLPASAPSDTVPVARTPVGLPDPATATAMASDASPDGDRGATPDPARKRPPWLEKLRAELTANNLEEHGVGDDLGSETRAAFDGLRNETFELDPLLGYILTRFEDAWVVPASHHFHDLNGECRDQWQIAYENSSGGASIARIDAGRSNGSDYVCFELCVNQWGREVDPDLELEPRITFHLHRGEPGQVVSIHGQIGLYQDLSDRVPTEKFAELARQFRYLTLVWLGAEQGQPWVSYARTKAGRAVTAHEITQLETLFQHCLDEASEFAKPPKSK